MRELKCFCWGFLMPAGVLFIWQTSSVGKQEINFENRFFSLKCCLYGLIPLNKLILETQQTLIEQF